MKIQIDDEPQPQETTSLRLGISDLDISALEAKD